MTLKEAALIEAWWWSINRSSLLPLVDRAFIMLRNRGYKAYGVHLAVNCEINDPDYACIRSQLVLDLFYAT